MDIGTTLITLVQWLGGLVLIIAVIAAMALLSERLRRRSHSETSD